MYDMIDHSLIDIIDSLSLLEDKSLGSLSCAIKRCGVLVTPTCQPPNILELLLL